uniref:Uncharacterized protein n=1 Tax=Glycine max TaxID=3847 RepID=C6TAZ9_SOYBN|nr:unknown [Glycine max]
MNAYLCMMAFTGVSAGLVKSPFSAGFGRSPLSLHVSIAPVYMSSKLYLNLNPKSVIFLEENLTSSN